MEAPSEALVSTEETHDFTYEKTAMLRFTDTGLSNFNIFSPSNHTILLCWVLPSVFKCPKWFLTLKVSGLNQVNIATYSLHGPYK
jgi:hypothetical protein